MSNYSIRYNNLTNLKVSLDVMFGIANTPHLAQRNALDDLNARKITLKAQVIITNSGLTWNGTQYVYFFEVLFLQDSIGNDVSVNFLTSGQNINLM